MPFAGFHGLDLIVILVVALLIFGPKKLPEMGSAVGKSIKEFKKGMNELAAAKEEPVTPKEERPTAYESVVPDEIVRPAPRSYEIHAAAYGEEMPANEHVVVDADPAPVQHETPIVDANPVPSHHETLMAETDATEANVK